MNRITRRDFLGRSAAATAGLAAASVPAWADAGESDRPPNFVVIFADDLGYGDLGCYGHPTIRTPHLDRMAADGMRLTQFYSAAPVCTPSRAALMTGRLPIRSGMCSDSRSVLFPDSASGLPAEEITIAEALRDHGYATSCVGKWHLGHLPEFLPTRNGFDEYFGIPYSNDMVPSPLLDGEEVIEEPAEQTTLTRRYTERAVNFIERHQADPFFLYFPHTFPHVPLFASDAFQGASARGLFGDVVEELDWSVGQVIDTLARLGLDENTLVLFTSDNGPWLTQNLNGGSAGLLRGGKGSTWEGGMREPCIAHWPGVVPAGVCETGLASTLDILPTCLSLAGASAPADRILDGFDMTQMLRGEGPGEREVMYFYRGTKLWAIRKGPWKAHMTTQPGYGGERAEHDPPLLFHLEHDPSERHDVSEANPEVVADLMGEVAAHLLGVEDVESRLDKRL